MTALPNPSPVIPHPRTGQQIPGVRVPARCPGGCHLTAIPVVPQARCDHKCTMCLVCMDNWLETWFMLINERDPEFEPAIAMLERVI